MKIKKYKLFSILCLALIIAGCKVEDPYDTGETQAQKSDAQLRDDYLKKRLMV